MKWFAPLRASYELYKLVIIYNLIAGTVFSMEYVTVKYGKLMKFLVKTS